MKISISWLAELVDLDGLAIDAIVEKLTMTTALIEGVERTPVGLDDVRVGRVLERREHPDADRLSVCQVACGLAEPVTIVCGAPNVARGQTVPVVLPGGRLPGGLRIEERALRGVVSHGMICSERELDLGTDQSGIMVLDESLEIGGRLVEQLGLADQILDIDNKSITHRPDLWGHVGFARELGAIFDRPLMLPEIDLDLRAGAGMVPVDIDDLGGCPRYLGLRFSGIEGRTTPLWMTRRLENCGVRSISLAVDLSNYVMLELGQPTHPFDLERLAEGRIIVRRARDGETIETIDHVDRRLDSEMLVIADGQNPVAIAGVMGGAASEVSEQTRVFLLEAAAFDAVSLRKTSSRLGLRTDAVARFEKFLDWSWPDTALRRYAWLLRQECPDAAIDRLFTAAGDHRREDVRIGLRPERVRAKLGVAIDDEAMVRHLTSIGFGVEHDRGQLQVRVPSWRGSRDVTLEDDLVEEIGRLHGYDSVPACLPAVSCAPPLRDPIRELENDLTETLVTRCGMTEVLDYSMVEDGALERVRPDSAPEGLEESTVRLRNPITSDTSRLRRSLVPGMLRFIPVNMRFGGPFSLFQIGRAYLFEHAGDDGLPLETRELAIIGVGPQAGEKADALRRLKGRLEVLFESIHRPLAYGAVGEDSAAVWLHPRRRVDLLSGGEKVGVAGDIHPVILSRLNVERAVALAVMDVTKILAVGEKSMRFEPIPRFPEARFDLSLVAGWNVTIERIIDEIRSVHREWIRDAELFDIFTGKAVPEGKRSLAFRVSLRSDERTLEDSEVMKVREEIVDRLRRLGLELR